MNSVRQALDLIRPRELATSLLRGSWILLKLLSGLARRALRKAVQQPAGTSKRDGPPQAADGPGKEAGEEPPTTPPRPAGDRAQTLCITALALLVAAATLSSLATGLLYLLRPYAPAAVTVLTLAWTAAALTADTHTRYRNDHDDTTGDTGPGTTAGTEPEKPADPWPATRELLRVFVEHRVAAGAAGFNSRVKGRGARVDDLLAEQQQHGGLEGYDRKAMTELLERAGIPVRQQMKFRVREDLGNPAKWREKNSPGVHIEDLTTALGRTPKMPPHLVPDLTPGAPPVQPEETPRNVIPIPLARAAGE